MTHKTFREIFVTGIALRVFMISDPPLWYDENFTLLLARLPWVDMISATRGDVHPPLWYALEWAIFHIAPAAPVWVIRVPALLFSIAALALFAAVMFTLQIPPKVQTAAFVLMAVMPFQLWYAQEGRMYAMLEFLVLLALLAALHRDYPLLFIASLGLLFTQNYGPLYLAAIALVLMTRERMSIYNRSFGVMASAGVLWLPWMITVTQQMSGIEGRYWIMDNSAGALVIIVYKLFLTAAVPSRFFFASYLVTFAALIFGCVSFIRSRHAARATVAIMAFVPLLLAWVISLAWQPILLFRPLIGISPFLYLITAWSLEE